MTLWRRVIPRIVRVSLVCAFVGTYVTLVATAGYALWMFTEHVPPLLDEMETFAARCAAEPAGFTTTVGDGTLVRTFDLRRLPEGADGPDPALLGSILRGDRSAMRLVWFQEHGGILLFRRGEGGPCSLMEVRWRIEPKARGGTFVVSVLIAALSAFAAGLLIAFYVVRPIIGRVQRLGRAATRMGEATGYSPADDGSADELGTLSRQLDEAHRRIRSATEELLARNERLESHLADVAHDLKTPLSAIQLSLESLAREGGSAAETARDCLDDCVYLAAMIDNLRVGSQLVEGMSPAAEGARAEMGELMEQVVRRLRPLGRWRGVELDCAGAGIEVWVGCRPLALERVIDNLVSNAVRHGRQGGHVAVLLEVDAGRFRLTVMDDGPGVPPEKFAMLGRRRFRGATSNPHGTGLGLSIVAEVCQRCGWELTFEPNAPNGLRVVVSGPVLAPPSPDAAAA